MSPSVSFCRCLRLRRRLWRLKRRHLVRAWKREKVKKLTHTSRACDDEKCLNSIYTCLCVWVNECRVWIHGAPWLVNAESTSGIAAERVSACARARASPDSNLRGSAAIPLAYLRGLCHRQRRVSRRWLMWSRCVCPPPRSRFLATRALGYYVGCDPVSATSEYLKMEVVYIGACIYVFFLYTLRLRGIHVGMCVGEWILYVAEFLTATRRDSFFVWSSWACVSFVPGEIMQISFSGSFPSSTALISSDHGKIWHDSCR